MIADELRSVWRAERFEQLTKLYADDALLDIYIPADRMQFRGTDAIGAFWRQDFGRPRRFRFLHWVEHHTPWGSVIETSVLDEPTGEYFRWVNLVFTADDRIVQHVIYCTGAWTPTAAQRWEPDQDAIRRAMLSAGNWTATEPAQEIPRRVSA
jgi:glycine/D-amino acid oxidase-like deaminating enzyme